MWVDEAALTEWGFHTLVSTPALDRRLLIHLARVWLVTEACGLTRATKKDSWS